MEARSQIRHEFVDGYLFTMAGGTADHNRICSRLLRLIYDAAEASGCELFISGMILQTPGGKGYYPDLFLTCEESNGKARFKQLPCWIIEVLLESTEVIDRGEKLHSYKAIPSLKAYILVSQDQKLVEVYRRLGDGTYPRGQRRARATLPRAEGGARGDLPGRHLTNPSAFLTTAMKSPYSQTFGRLERWRTSSSGRLTGSFPTRSPSS